jgi:hypothetical protein
MATKKPAKQKTEVATLPREVEGALAFVVSEKPGVDEALGMIRAIVIEDATALASAGEVVREVARRHDAIDAKRKSWVEPLKRVAKDIDATFKPLLDALKEAEKLLKDKIGSYALAQAAARTKAIAAAGALSQSDPEAASAAIAEAVALEAPKLDGVGATIEWDGEVIDAALIPREYLIPDVAALRAMTKAAARDPKIPGWRAFQRATVRTARK